MIAYIVDHHAKCPLGAYPRLIKDKAEYAKHIRWAHSRKTLYEWIYHNLIETQVAVYP